MSYERILLTLLRGGAWREEQSIRFWWRSVSDPDPLFLDADHDPGFKFLKGFFICY